MKTVAIIGAGAAGLAAAWTLEQEGISVHLFEKSRGVSGRATTRRRDDRRYDHGAQFFKLTDKEVAHLVQEVWPAHALQEVPGPIWTVDSEQQRHPGSPERNAEKRWCYRDGINGLGRAMASQLKGELHKQTLIKSLRQDRHTNHWWLNDDQRRSHGPFQAVLVTAPGPQAVELIDASGMDLALRDTLVTSLQQIRYRASIALILSFAEPLPRTEPFYALVRKEGAHPVGWLAFESDKPGRSAHPRETLLIAQMSHEWSVPRLRDPLEALIQEALPLVSETLGFALPTPEWFDAQRWRFSQPLTTLSSETVAPAGEVGLFFAGDGFAGGRLSPVLQNGVDTARRLLHHLHR